MEELERARLGVRLEECWCGALMCGLHSAGGGLGVELQTRLEVVQAYVMRWRMKFNSRKSRLW